MKKAISAGGIVLKKENGNIKICLVELTPPMTGHVLPKGHVHSDESVEEAATREVKEETGVTKLRVIKKLGVVTRKSTENDGTEVVKDIHLFLMETDNSRQTNAEEKYNWFSFDETLQKLTFKEEQNFLIEHKSDLIVSSRYGLERV